MSVSEGNNRMPYVCRNHALVSMSDVQCFWPSSDIRHFCIRVQKPASPRMVSSLFSGVEYKWLLATAHGCYVMCFFG